MRNLQSMAVKIVDGRLQVLDQRLLPHRTEWLLTQHPQDMVAAIKSLQVRGAPLIGVAAALSLALYAESGVSESLLRQAAQDLRDARPTAVNLMVAIDRLLDGPLTVVRLTSLAEQIFTEDVELCQKMAVHGAELIRDGDQLLTHCNTGGLATAGVGTALGVIAEAHRRGKKIHVYVDETRPLLQGGRLTAWELTQLGIPHTLICDNMAAALMRDGKVNKVLVGSDRIALNGDFANKVGTYGVAVLAKHHGVDFFVVAPHTTIDFTCPTGHEIPIEERKAEEVRGVAGYFSENFQQIQWAPQSAVWNPAFDMTPVELVTALILDSGVYTRDRLQMGALRNLAKAAKTQ